MGCARHTFRRQQQRRAALQLAPVCHESPGGPSRWASQVEVTHRVTDGQRGWGMGTAARAEAAKGQDGACSTRV
jgi:hypothetical protein